MCVISDAEARSSSIDVHISRKGPFDFVLDTGASLTVVSPALAKDLELEKVGGAASVSGDAQLLRVESWRAGRVKLPETLVVSTKPPSGLNDLRIHGLLGSDVSQFDYVTIDYDEQRLTLGPPR